MDDALAYGLVVCAVMGLVTALVASSKGKHAGLWFIYGFLIWPVALTHAIVSPPNVKQQETAALARGDTRKCPFCAELIKSEAIVCRYCNRDVSPVPTQQNPNLSVEDLVLGLQSSDPRVRERSASAIGDLGSGGASVLPVLEALRQDSDRRVRARAAWAIESIGRAGRSS